MAKATELGKIYSFAKSQKYCPLRPVLSAINTPEYNISKWFENDLKSYLKSKLLIRFQFMDKSNKLKPNKTNECVRFDIRTYTLIFH